MRTNIKCKTDYSPILSQQIKLFVKQLPQKQYYNYFDDKIFIEGVL